MERAGLRHLILAGFAVAGFVGELDEAVAVIILSLVYGPQIVRGNSNTATMAPDWLRVGGCSGFRLRSLHSSDLSLSTYRNR